MLAFIRKRLPSKERTLDQEDDQMKKPKSDEKKKKKATKTKATTIDELVFHPDPSPTMNQSYSEIDYFPMKSSNAVQTQNPSDDCYMNTSDTVITQPIRSPVIKSRIIDIPITFIKK